jgi:hypothetical protein
VNILLACIVVLLLSGIVFGLQPRLRSERIIYWAAWTTRCLAGLALGLLYSTYYPSGDTFSVFDDSAVLASWGREEFLSYLSFLWSSDPSPAIWSSLHHHEPRTLFFTKALSLINLISGGQYLATSLILSSISFAGAWSLYRTLVHCFEPIRVSAAVAFLFMPSVVLWTSGIIKESIAMAGLFYLSGCVIILFQEKKIRIGRVVLMILAGWLVWKLKYFYLGVFLPVAVGVVILRWLPKMKISLMVLAFGVLLVTGGVIVSLVHPNFDSSYLPQVIAENYREYSRRSEPGDAAVYPGLTDEPSTLLKNAPLALVTGLFRPAMGEARSGLQWLSSVENTFVLAVFLLSIVNLIWRPSKGQTSFLVPAVIVYIILLAVLVALSTPNFGTLSRYRVGYYPFFVLLILHRSRCLEAIAAWRVKLFGGSSGVR